MDLREFVRMRGFDPLIEDAPVDPAGPSTRNERLSITCGSSIMNGLLMLPQGAGPHPSALFLHGFPGHETNMDIAHAMRRAGFACFLFHYRGAWGSEGQFSFSNMVEDVISALDHIRSRKDELSLSGHPLVIGFSMGGWAGVMASSLSTYFGGLVWMAGANLGLFKIMIEHSEEARGKAIEAFRDSLGPLRGATVEGLLKEVTENGERWDPCSLADSLKDRPVLMIAANRDTTAPTAIHFEPFRLALEGAACRDLEVARLEADHNFTNRRMELTRTVLDWSLKRWDKW